MIHRRRTEISERVEHDEVGLITRAELAEVEEVVEVGGVVRGEHEGIDLAESGLDSEPDAVVDVADGADLVRFAIVGAHGCPSRAVVQHGREQLHEVAARRSVAQEHPHTLLALLVRFVGLEGFVIGFDTGGEIGVELGAAQSGCMAVDTAPAGGGDDLTERRITVDDGGVVHHLTHADGVELVDDVAHVRGGEGGSRAFER